MKILLAVETCNQTCSVALLRDGEVLQQVERQPRQHAQLVLPMVHKVLAAGQVAIGDLDAIAFGAGPGSFTGLRIAAAVTQGLAVGAGVPTISVSTLAALALEHGQAGETIVAGFDARMGEVYAGIYQLDANANLTVLLADTVSAAQDVVLSTTTDIVGLGSAWGEHGEALSAALGCPTRVDADAEPTAAAVATLALQQWQADSRVLQPAIHAQPIYLRNNVAKKSQKARRG